MASAVKFKREFDQTWTFTWTFTMLALIVAVDAQETLTNIDFLGLGYDALKGNPHADLRDPGFLDPVLALHYDERATTSDRRWQVPDKVHVQRMLSCSFDSQSAEIHGTTAYRDALSADASVGGDGWGARFSASAQFNEVRTGSSQNHKTYVSSVARCLVYRASVRRFARILVAPDFADAVDLLPTAVADQNNIDETYLEFISAFGTHYASALDMGAKAVLRSEFEQTSWTRMVQSNLDIRAVASASFLVFSGRSSASSSRQREHAETFDGRRTTFKASYLGSRPPADGRWETWAQTTDLSPYPIGYVLRPLTELLTPR